MWLPREDQLRDLLGDRFVSLELLPGPPQGWAVTVSVDGEPGRHVDVDPEAAYVRALLAVGPGV